MQGLLAILRGEIFPRKADALHAMSARRSETAISVAVDLDRRAFR